nr:ribonuclease H-like domain-containing protein [Tanacetum cinerariifolium]
MVGAMISMRIKKFHKRTWRKLQFDTKNPDGFDKTKVECFNCHKMTYFARDCRAKGNQDSRRRDVGYNGNKARDNGRRPAYQNDSKVLVTVDGEDIEYANGMHAVPPLMTGNYITSRPDVEMDYSKFTYGPKQTSVDESDSKPSKYASCKFDSSVKTTTSMPELVEITPKVVCEPKVWTDAPIIKEYKLDSDDDSVSNVQEDKEKPSFAFNDSVKILLLRPQQVVIGITKEILGIKSSNTTDDPHKSLKDKGIVDSGYFRHMTGNKAHLADYQEFKGGSVAFEGSNKRITGKEKIKAGRLDFEDVYYVEELKHYNLFSMSQMCNKKTKVLFTYTDYLVLSPEFKLPDKNQVLLKTPRQHNMYSFNLKNIDPSGDLACLFAKASTDESNKWHRRLGHVNFKNLNKLVKGNLVRGLPSKIFENDHTCVTCQKEKQHKAFCKAKTELENLKRQEKEANVEARKETTHENQDAHTNSTNLLNVVSTPLSVIGPSREFNDGELSYPDDPSMPHLEDISACPSEGIFTDLSYDDEGVVTDFNNLETTMNVSPTPTTRIHTIHPKNQILKDLMLAVQTRSKVNRNYEAHTLKIKVRLMLCKRNCCSSRFRRQEEGIDYDNIFAPVARIEAIRIFLAFASYMGFIVYQMDVKSAFLYGTIDEEMYVSQPPSFVDTKFPNKVYKVVKAIYGLHQAPRACVKTASTPIETQKPLVKDEEADDVDVYLYRSMIGSLMYLTASRPDIMFVVCACSRFQ